jgi:hypothetical protein
MKKMYKHIVLWKLKSNTDARQKAEQLDRACAMLRGLPALIEGIRHYEVGVNIADYGASFFDFSLISVFGTQQDFEAYCRHPEHDKVVGFIASITEQEKIVDYKAG